ncbi:MAG: 50S ribosomal protein L32 [Bacilli bacterium]|nr:50S ribosomal protein L32 [Bacilli bacterium]MBQ9853885.1 50S ribosomal protein L32 [Bacilli bacterium]
MKVELNLQLFGPLPARRVSKTSKRMRRTHLKKEAPTVVKCANCGAAVAPHRACTKCGFYKGKEVLKQNKDEE